MKNLITVNYIQRSWLGIIESAIIMLTNLDRYSYFCSRYKKYFGKWSRACANPFIDMEIIEQHLDEVYDWDGDPPIYAQYDIELKAEYKAQYNHIKWMDLAANPNLTTDIIEKYIDAPWPWDNFCRTLPITFLEKHIKRIETRSENPYPENPYPGSGVAYNAYDYIALNDGLTIEFILKFRDRNWNWALVSLNPGILFNDIIQNPDIPWVWNAVMANSNTPEEFIEAHPEFWENRPNIVSLGNKSPAFIEKHIGKAWDWSCLSEFCSLEFALKYPENIDYDKLSMNWVPLEFIVKNIDKKWNWSHLSSNPNITMEFILKNMDKDWDWTAISSVTNISLNDVEANMTLPWNWEILSTRISDIVFIERNDNIKWNLDSLSLCLDVAYIYKYDYYRSWSEEVHPFITPLTQSLIITCLLLLENQGRENPSMPILPLELIYEILES